MPKPVFTHFNDKEIHNKKIVKIDICTHDTADEYSDEIQYGPRRLTVPGVLSFLGADVVAVSYILCGLMRRSALVLANT